MVDNNDNNENNENGMGEDPDILRSMSVAEIVDDAIESFQEEVSGYASNGIGLSDPYPDLCIAQIILRAVSRDYPNSLSKFEYEESKVDEIYGNPDDRGYVLTNLEAGIRLRNTLILDKDIGHGKIDEANAYSPGSQPDNVDFTDWGED